MVVVGLVAGSLRPSRGRRSNLYFSPILCLAIKSPEHFACTHPVHAGASGSLLVDWWRPREHTGQGYLVVDPGFGCMSPAIRRSRSNNPNPNP